MYEKKTYLPGVVGCYQKPWFTRDGGIGNIVYYGRFSPKGRPGEVNINWTPIRDLISKVKDPELQDQMMELVEEMQDAVRQIERNGYDNIPSYLGD
jgi:hypothetical protein